MDISDISLLSAKRINALKCPFATRRVPRTAFATLLGGARRPRVGDLVLARVHQLGQDAHLELACGRLARLFVGDEIVLAYGISQSPDQFEAGMPVELRSCHLVAAGGLAGRVSTRHEDSLPATTIQPIGLLGDRSARALNLAAFALPAPAPSGLRPFTIAVLGAASKAGKPKSSSFPK